MTPPYSWRAAQSLLRSSRRGALTSFVTWTNGLGLALAVVVMVTVLSVVNGFERELEERVLRFLPHAQVQLESPPPDWRPLVEEAEAVAGVRAAAPYVQGAVLVVAGGALSSATLWGAVPEQEVRLSGIDEALVAGRLDDLAAGSFRAVLGARLAASLGVAPGDRVDVVLPELRVTPAGLYPRQRRVTVTGLLRTGTELDSQLLYMHLDDAAALLRVAGGFTGLKLATTDLFAVTAVLREVVWQLIAHGPRGYDWRRTHGNLHQAIQLQKVIMAILLTLIVLVAAFNLVSTMVMQVRSRATQLAIQRTFGASRAQLLRGVLLAGALAGFVGTATGLGLGLAVAFALEPAYRYFAGALGIDLMAEYFVHALPSQPRVLDCVIVALLAWAASLTASLYPAWRAASVLPARVLRHE